MIHVHRLAGCTPTPLASYLKALGILRNVTEQLDPGARGWWHDDVWHMSTNQTEAELLQFFQVRFAPTPLISPWNKGAGFYAEHDRGVSPIESSRAERFAPYRWGIAAARALCTEIADADAAIRRIKDESNKAPVGERKAIRSDPDYKARLAAANRQFKVLKEGDLIPACLAAWRGQVREWIDAALVVSSEGVPSYPALIGTGGNDGNLDFTNNAMQRLGELFDLDSDDAPVRAMAVPWLHASLFGNPAPGLVRKPVGQFAPGNAGGVNSGFGPDGHPRLNPWDFVFVFEGAILFAAHSSRRLGTQRLPHASAPFAVRSRAVGYASASAEEESTRGEQWMPIWQQPLSLIELRALLSEGRAQIGRKTASRPIDLARAVAGVGAARGIHSFQRFGYLERNGQSNLAVPLGRFVTANGSRTDLVDDISDWLDRLHRSARKDHAPARLKQIEKVLSDAVFAALTQPDSSRLWQDVLIAMTRVERIQVAGTGFEAQPIPSLSETWVEAVQNDSSEFRLAVALGAARIERPDSPSKWRESLRPYFLPLDDKGIRFSAGDHGLRRDPRVVANGRSAVRDLMAIVMRCSVEAQQRGQRNLPICPTPGLEARLADLRAVTQGAVDLDRTLSLARALMAVRYRAFRSPAGNLAGSTKLEHPDDPWLVLRMAVRPHALEGRQNIRTDAALLRHLQAGDAPSAIRIALRHLQSDGIVPTLRVPQASRATARLWLAALAFPIADAAFTEIRLHLHAKSKED